MEKIKVLHVIKTLNLGGAETNLFNLVQEINPDLFEVLVAYSFGGVVEARFKDINVELFRYARSAHKIRSLASLMIIIRLIVYILKNNIQIIHTHTYNAHVWGAIAAELTGRKIVEHVHDFRYEEPYYLKARGVRPGQYILAEYFARLSDLVIVLTKNNKKRLLEHNNSFESKVRIAPNGISLNNDIHEKTSEIRRRLNIPENKRIIVAAARIAPEKNMGIILEIANKLKEKYSNFIFIIAGEGPLKERLEKALLAANLNNEIRFIGFYNDVKELFSIASVFVQPTLLELHSIAMLEAMSMGVPVIAAKGVGANDDFIKHKENGFLLDPRNASEWAETIGLVLDNPDLSRSIAANGKKLVENKSDIKKTARTFETIYSELMQEK